MERITARSYNRQGVGHAQVSTTDFAVALRKETAPDGEIEIFPAQVIRGNGLSWDIIRIPVTPQLFKTVMAGPNNKFTGARL
ncbi:MAG TPA: hypothetical protein VFD58_35025 [Blastocatellia bacterium]|nr:hypothetical protein [Blastocatellia bacterium]